MLKKQFSLAEEKQIENSLIFQELTKLSLVKEYNCWAPSDDQNHYINNGLSN